MATPRADPYRVCRPRSSTHLAQKKQDESAGDQVATNTNFQLGMVDIFTSRPMELLAKFGHDRLLLGHRRAYNSCGLRLCHPKFRPLGLCDQRCSSGWTLPHETLLHLDRDDVKGRVLYTHAAIPHHSLRSTQQAL